MIGLSLNLMSCLQDLDKDLDKKHADRLQGIQNEKLSQSYKLNIREANIMNTFSERSPGSSKK